MKYEAFPQGVGLRESDLLASDGSNNIKHRCYLPVGFVWGWLRFGCLLGWASLGGSPSACGLIGGPIDRRKI